MRIIAGVESANRRQVIGDHYERPSSCSEPLFTSKESADARQLEMLMRGLHPVVNHCNVTGSVKNYVLT